MGGNFCLLLYVLKLLTRASGKILSASLLIHAEDEQDDLTILDFGNREL